MKWLVPLLLAAAGQVHAEDSARQWLDEMSSALQTLDYDGTFVYLHDGRMDAMRIIHQVSEGGQRERLVSLTGSAREVLRDNKAVTCIKPDNKSVMIGKSRPRPPFPVLPRDLGKASRNYQVEDVGEDRMAGYNARVIAIKPLDEFRYGYRFWIEQNTRMLLKYELSDPDGVPIEQVMFTRIGIGADIPPSELQPSLTGDGYTWHRQEDVRGTPVAATAEPGWQVRRLPDGFMLTNFQQKRMREDAEAAEHMVFSDGLATVSVYVEKREHQDDSLNGLSTMGAMNAYGLSVDGYQVMVVGEVPPATVRMIAHSLERSG
ncbi:MAG: MucB/RseB C-terminal domain-containing protein [Gammaproteobacteria bacterium]